MTVLLAYVPTAEGWVALDSAIEEAKLRGSSIEVVNVAIGSNFADVTFADEKDLDDAQARITAAGLGCHVTQILDAEDVATQVLKLSEQLGAELIVVGLRRRSPLGMALLGSNAQRIILSATCPVLSIRPPSE
jgi:nucleotide-binding universal stress UspA family protein